MLIRGLSEEVAQQTIDRQNIEETKINKIQLVLVGKPIDMVTLFVVKWELCNVIDLPELVMASLPTNVYGSYNYSFGHMYLRMYRSARVMWWS